jgi:putative ABC transport system ATP-binding protein
MDYVGLLLDGATQGLLYAPVTIAFALLYAHAREIDVSIDAAVIMAGVAFGMGLTSGLGMIESTLLGLVVGCSVTLFTGVINMYLNVPFLVGGLIVSFIMAATSTYLVGERLSLLTLPRIFVTPPRVFDYLWLPLLSLPIIGFVMAVVRSFGQPLDAGKNNTGRRYMFWAVLAIVFGSLSLIGAMRGSVHTIHIAVVFAVVIWLIGSVFHKSDRGLAHRAIGANLLFRLRTDWRAIRLSTLLLVGSITGLTGVILAQYKAQAISGGSFNIVIGALASYVLFDRLAVWSQRGKDSLRISGATEKDWRVASLSVIADTNPATRAILGCLVFYIATQFVIAFVRQPELPRLFIGGFLLLVLGEWNKLYATIARAIPNQDQRKQTGPEVMTLATHDLWKGFARGSSILQVLTGVDLSMAPTERIVRIRGTNAAGKSTLFRIIDGTLEPDRGQCSVEGITITNMSRSKRPIYLITQNPFDTVVSGLTVAENLRLAMLQRYRPVSGALEDEWKERAAAVLRRYGLLDIITKGSADGLETLAGNLSGGQAQCLAFAMAATAGPKLIMADEPTANLDPNSTEIVLRLIETVSKEFPILLVSHDERVDRVCQRTYVLRGGRIYDDVKDNGPTNVTKVEDHSRPVEPAKQAIPL